MAINLFHDNCSYRGRGKTKNFCYQNQLSSRATTRQSCGTVARGVKGDAFSGPNIMFHYLSGPVSLGCDVIKYSISFFLSLTRLVGKIESYI